MPTDPYTVADDQPRPPAARAPGPAPSAPPAPAPAAPQAPPTSPPSAAELAFAVPAPEEPAPATARGPRPRAREVVFKRPADREARCELKAPFTADGVDWDFVTVRRINTAEMMAFIDVLQGTDDATSLRWPIYYGPDGEPIPEDIWAAMDPDDSDRVSTMGEGFLPSRFRPRTSAASLVTTTTATPGGSGSTGSTSG